MKAYMYDEHTKEYIGEVEAQIDPLESELAEEEVYLLPANSTFEEPMEEQEGFKIVFDGEKWVSEEKPEPEVELEVEEKTLNNEDIELIRASLYRRKVDDLMAEHYRKKTFGLFKEGEEEALLAEVEAKVAEIKEDNPYVSEPIEEIEELPVVEESSEAEVTVPETETVDIVD